MGNKASILDRQSQLTHLTWLNILLSTIYMWFNFELLFIAIYIEYLWIEPEYYSYS